MGRNGHTMAKLATTVTDKLMASWEPVGQVPDFIITVQPITVEYNPEPALMAFGVLS